MMKQSWAVFFLGGLIASLGCSERRLLAPPDGGAATSAEQIDVAQGENLGVHSFPEVPPPNQVSWHAWNTDSPRPTTVRIGYAHGTSEAASIRAHLESLATRVNYRDLGDGRYRWLKPAACSSSGIGCILTALEARSRPNLQPLTRALHAAILARKLSRIEAAEFLLRMVQAIPYEIPRESPFGLLPPATVMSERRGDCDSKSLLLSHLLAAVGIRSLLISSSAHAHTMLGIAVPTTGRSFEAEGTRYAYAETTAQGSPLGFITPGLLSPNDWRTVPKQADIPTELVSLN